MEITFFKKIGLSDKDAKVYLKLIEHGPISVRVLAQLSGLNRGTTYDILKNLQKKGLVSYFHHDTKQNFVAEDPVRFNKLIKDREEELDEVKKRIDDIIPELKSLQAKGDKPVTKYYEGKEGIRFILDDILSTMKDSKDKVYYIYSAPGVREDIYAAYPDFIKKRIKYKLNVKTISLSEGGDTYGLDERKWLEKEGHDDINMTYILIYHNKCAFISRNPSHKPVGVIIENKMIYETQKIIFDQLWKFL